MANALCMYRIFCYTGHYLTPSLTPSWLMLQQVNHDPLENHTFPQMNGLANPYCMMLGCSAMASLAPISFTPLGGLHPILFLPPLLELLPLQTIFSLFV
jgi:hypothetical protein